MATVDPWLPPEAARVGGDRLSDRLAALAPWQALAGLAWFTVGGAFLLGFQPHWEADVPVVLRWAAQGYFLGGAGGLAGVGGACLWAARRAVVRHPRALQAQTVAWRAMGGLVGFLLLGFGGQVLVSVVNTLFRLS